MENENKSKLRLDLSTKHFQKIVTVCLLIGIIIVSGFIIYYILTPEEGSISLGILDENKLADNPPENLTIGENVTFYISVVNNLKRDAEFKIYILKGDNDTLNQYHHNDSGAKINDTIENIVINNGKEWLSEPQKISFYELGDNHMVIVELWEIFSDDSEKYWIHDWFRLNITAS
jgi:uncharacterized membrane protein